MDSARILFYNCGNLFDTLDAEGKADDGYTPEGTYEWDREHYRGKQERIARVIGDLVNTPSLVGLCEVENRKVIEDLLRTAPMNGAEYGFLHHRSRDPRGVDLTLLFDPERFQPYAKKAFRITNPGSGTPSRPVLTIGMESSAGDSIRIFLCHWPSRSGGKAESETDRLNASRILQKALKELHKDHPSRKVLIMGDLNDHPPNKSVQGLIEGDHGQTLQDLMEEAHAAGKGTYNYRGEWGVLDHFIINEELSNAKDGLSYKKGSAHILRTEEMLYYDEEGGHYQPDRYMERGTYYGGYSDHLPIVMELTSISGP